MAKTSSSFTLIDYNDAISIISGIESNLPTTVLVSSEVPRVCQPSWAESPLVLTPRIFKAGSSDNITPNLTNTVWSIRYAGQNYTVLTSGSDDATIDSATKTLTINANKLHENYNQVEFKFEGVYLDVSSQLEFPITTQISFSRVFNGGDVTLARAYVENGDTFKNKIPETLTIKAELMYGIEVDIVDNVYQWQWFKSGSWQNVPETYAGSNPTNSKTSILTVHNSMVNSMAQFRCKITDNNSPKGAVQVYYTEGISILDVTDTIQCVIESTAGSYFKNNTGTTKLIAKLYQNGQEIDHLGTDYSYTWYKTDQNGSVVSDWTPVATTYGDIVATNNKCIEISHSQVEVKSTFFCEVD